MGCGWVLINAWWRRRVRLLTNCGVVFSPKREETHVRRGKKRNARDTGDQSYANDRTKAVDSTHLACGHRVHDPVGHIDCEHCPSVYSGGTAFFRGGPRVGSEPLSSHHREPAALWRSSS